MVYKDRQERWYGRKRANNNVNHFNGSGDGLHASAYRVTFLASFGKGKKAKRTHYSQLRASEQHAAHDLVGQMLSIENNRLKQLHLLLSPVSRLEDSCMSGSEIVEVLGMQELCRKIHVHSAMHYM